MNRVPQIVLIASVFMGSWLGMQDVHEAGHVIGAWMTGGRVARVVLHPLAISRTDLAENPRPLVVVWAGPAIGVIAPLVVWGMGAAARIPGGFVLRFFAGFCCLANGLYLGFGSFGQVGDCGEMLRLGTAPWVLWLFGAATAPTGVWLWHGQSVHFGFGPARGCVDRRIALGSLVSCLALLAGGWLWAGIDTFQ